MRFKFNRAALLFFALLASLVGCGGGGTETPKARILAVPDVVLTAIDPRLVIADLPYGLHVDQVISFTLLSEDYFKQNPVGHFGIVTRADLSQWATRVLGHGLAIGNLAGADGGSQVVPGAQIESWCNGSNPADYLLAASASPQLRDGVSYEVAIYTHASPGRQTVRYTLAQGGAQIYDSGLVDDPNRGFDPAMNGVGIGHVFDSADAGLWLIRLSNIRIELS